MYFFLKMWAFVLPVWTYVLVGFCPRGFCPRGFCPRGFCPTLRPPPRIAWSAGSVIRPIRHCFGQRWLSPLEIIGPYAYARPRDRASSCSSASKSLDCIPICYVHRRLGDVIVSTGNGNSNVSFRSGKYDH